MPDNVEEVTLVTSLIALAIFLFAKWENEKKRIEKLAAENSRLIADNALFEADQLKYQLQPHTLNNILANLKAFSNKLNKGMDGLSETLDYILYRGNTNLVSVKDEIEFIKNYLDLNDLFINEIESVKLDTSNIDENSKFYNDKCIPHLISAHFIENAFKHGNLNDPEFLQIVVGLNNTSFQLEVVNKISTNIMKSTGGIGLSNMQKRLELLSINKFEITHGASGNEYHSTLIINFPNE
jgi:LytS/YehU family sensor histidine kinase